MYRIAECFLYDARLKGVPEPNRIRKHAVPGPRKAYFHCFGVLFNHRAFWLGYHYGARDKRLCINLLPCLTLWWARPGGVLP